MDIGNGIGHCKLTLASMEFQLFSVKKNFKIKQMAMKTMFNVGYFLIIINSLMKFVSDSGLLKKLPNKQD